jgi:hypothetical protein
MSRPLEPIGSLFPIGGPLPSDLIVGRRGEIDEINERALNGMFGAPVHFGKLVDRIELDARIPLTSWREPLTERFARAGLLLEDAGREELLKWSEGRPYATMAAARYTAQSARRTSSDTATEFDVQMGIDEAERHLRDDGA